MPPAVHRIASRTALRQSRLLRNGPLDCARLAGVGDLGRVGQAPSSFAKRGAAATSIVPPDECR